MLRHRSRLPSSTERKTLFSRLIAGFTALVATAIISASGFAAASPNNPPNTDNPPSKAACESKGYTNYGQCVKDWAHAKNKPGHGYGGNGNISIIIIINIILNNSNFNNIQNNIQVNFR